MGRCDKFSTRTGATYLCSVGRRAKAPPPACYKCGRPATRACDYRPYSRINVIDEYGRRTVREAPGLSTCSRPLCAACTHHFGENTDFCDAHADEISRSRTEKAERLFRAECRRIGIDPD